MSATTRNQVFSAVHTVGALLPVDILLRISEGKDVSGSKPADYGVIGSRSVRDDAERHWDYLKAIWRELRVRLPENEETGAPAADPTGLAGAQWLEPLFAELGFGRLTAVGAAGLPADSDPGKLFPISHRWQNALVHLTAWNADLDKRPGGAGTVPPQSMVQECLNRAEAHLWAVLTNGRQLRLLRDSSALATASYVEFDLEAIFDGELFSEFVLLYRLLHVSRFEVGEGAAPSGCWLEKWRTEAIVSGTRALDHHRDGVQRAITTLGTGFLKHRDNAALRKDLDVKALHAALLRLAYRLIFLFVAEDRDALHPPTAAEEARRRYATYFSSGRLRRQAGRRRGTAHADLYQSLKLVLDALGDENGRPELGLPGLGGLFDDTDADSPLRGLSLSNTYLLEAVRHLSRVRDTNSARWRPVDYRNMGSEELGSIYESLLELVPKHSATESTFELVNRLGNDRKKTGSYYTPRSLIETLLDSTLDPVIDDAQKRGEQRAAAAGQSDASEVIVGELLSLTVCDPACGSGHFLVSAARRIAKRVAAVRESNPEPTPVAVRHALHEVIARCIYGVDLNPMAVELAKVSLWLEALEPGKPLGFLDAHVKLGNGLIGATPALMRDGIPSKAFKAVEGDDPKYATFLEKQNTEERKGQGGLFDLAVETKVANTVFASDLRRITDARADTLSDVHRQASAYRDWETSSAYVQALHVADAWCAAFMWHKTKDAPPAITHDLFRALEDPQATAASTATHDEIVRLSAEYRFFHWHLEFPEVFSVPEDGNGTGDDVDRVTGWAGGFSCVVGNPPWDKVDFEDKKYFSVVEPSIAAIAGTARRNRISEWETEDPEAGEHYRAERRKVKSTFLFAGGSGAFPLCGKGLTVKGVNSLQTDQLFVERFASIAASEGRLGCIVPTAIATGAGAQHLFSDFTRRGVITSLYDFENRKPLFVGVHSSYKFCLFSLTGRSLHEPVAKFAFFLEDTIDLDDTDRVFSLSPDEIVFINPNSGTLPIFRTRRDADLTAAIYRHIPVLWNESEKNGNPWGASFKRLFDMTDDSDLFRTREELEAEGWELYGNVFARDEERMLPLYEGKMAHHFDHRWNSYHGTGNEERRRLGLAEKQDAEAAADPRYWIAEDGWIPTVRNGKAVKVPGITLRLRDVGWDRGWLCGWRDVCRTTDERTAIPALLPRAAVGHTYPLMLPRVSPALAVALVAAQSSLVFDFVSRQKISDAHMKLFIWKQLPVPTPEALTPHAPFITSRVLELVYTAHDMTPLARDLGDTGAPFRWDETRRAQIRAELDAYFFHLYGISRDDADYILETFQSDSGGGLKNNEIAKYGTYRTKNLVLAAYDRMATAGVTLAVSLMDGENFDSALTPPPGQGPRHEAKPAAGSDS
ncbi:MULTISPECIES: DNA methyltransferase [unclassified Kitasatospora]|uniref:Eco57I restriction-modification methylase domain-containing protein n=1 Tax=unclassified Kitasatospora TaxID=2633591 RepID=UPI00070C93A2|nr:MULTISPECIES: DNA methyltransferase [unclassified Kitasatospora]KQV14971.1 restriction endonuclease [Kitasatospora sp. Root107]KRB60696.1 restriction endonuclease [Kitasatospora sp. Root187]